MLFTKSSSISPLLPFRCVLSSSLLPLTPPLPHSLLSLPPRKQPRLFGVPTVLHLTLPRLPYHTPTILPARNARLEALAVLLQTPRLPAVAPLQVDQVAVPVSHHARLERVAVARQEQLLRFLALLLVLLRVSRRARHDEVVEAVDAVAPAAVRVGGEALAVELQTPRLLAVARARLRVNQQSMSHSVDRVVARLLLHRCVRWMTRFLLRRLHYLSLASLSLTSLRAPFLGSRLMGTGMTLLPVTARGVRSGHHARRRLHLGVQLLLARVVLAATLAETVVSVLGLLLYASPPKHALTLHLTLLLGLVYLVVHALRIESEYGAARLLLHGRLHVGGRLFRLLGPSLHVQLHRVEVDYGVDRILLRDVEVETKVAQTDVRSAFLLVVEATREEANGKRQRTLRAHRGDRGIIQLVEERRV